MVQSAWINKLRKCIDGVWDTMVGNSMEKMMIREELQTILDNLNSIFTILIDIRI